MRDHTERRKSPRTQETRERELLTLDYHGREVKTRVLAEDRAAVRSAVLAEVRAKVDALALDWPTLFTTADGTGYVRHTDIRAAIDAARTTGGRDA